jgi:predicted nucleotidyltransferase
MTTRFDPQVILGALIEADVDFVVIGGIAVQAYGVPRTTVDVDVVIGIDGANRVRAAEALTMLDAKAVGLDPPGSIDVTDPQMLNIGANYRLDTSAGELELFTGVVPGAAPFTELFARSVVVTVGGLDIRIVGIDDLLSMKREAGRKRDLDDIAALTDSVD